MWSTLRQLWTKPVELNCKRLYISFGSDWHITKQIHQVCQQCYDIFLYLSQEGDQYQHCFHLKGLYLDNKILNSPFSYGNSSQEKQSEKSKLQHVGCLLDDWISSGEFLCTNTKWIYCWELYCINIWSVMRNLPTIWQLLIWQVTSVCGGYRLKMTGFHLVPRLTKKLTVIQKVPCVLLGCISGDLECVTPLGKPFSLYWPTYLHTLQPIIPLKDLAVVANQYFWYFYEQNVHARSHRKKPKV